MSFTHAVRGDDLRYTPVGPVPQSEWLGGVRSGLTEPAERPRNLVFDCRAAADSRTSDQLRDLVELIGKHRNKLTERCAFLVSTDVWYGAARMMGAFLDPLGIETLVTTDEDEADQFLNRDPHAEPDEVWPTATAGF